MSRARSQAGFTVVEVLVAALILSIVATGAMKFVEVLLRQSRGVVERTDAMQRGRMALDQMTRSLRSQVCLNEHAQTGLVSAKPDEIKFYADFGTGVQPPQLRTLRYDSVERRLTETTIQGALPLTNPTFNAPPRTRVLLNGVTQDVDEQAQPPTQRPVFQYFAFDKDTPGTLAPLPAVTSTNIGRVALVRVTFHAGGFRDGKLTTRLEDDVLMRNTDPNAARPEPTCR